MIASICLSVCLSDSKQNDLKHNQQIMKVSAHYILVIFQISEGLTFNLSEIKGQGALLRSNLLFFVTLNFKLHIYCICGYILH